jgi:hypothetical protein
MYASARERARVSNTIIVKTKPCCVCNEYEIWSLDQELVDRWRGGENIQRVFPDMSAGEREVLISGIHPACWDKMFPGEGDDE